MKQCVLQRQHEFRIYDWHRVPASTTVRAYCIYCLKLVYHKEDASELSEHSS